MEIPQKRHASGYVRKLETIDYNIKYQKSKMLGFDGEELTAKGKEGGGSTTISLPQDKG